MKKAFPLHLLTSFIVLILTLGMISSTSAWEGDTPQVVLRVARASPGATIEVEGGRFEPDILVRFTLIQSVTQTPLGSVFADDHGEFTTSVFLPLELQSGQYEFQALDEKNRRAVAPLTIVPEAIEEEGNGQRENEDPLLAPMPTFAPGEVPGAAPEATQGAVSTGQYSVQYLYGIGIALLGLSLGTILLVLLKRGR
jgi:hypothetical protein